MFCANCCEKIEGKPIQQAHDVVCSLECANLAAGIEPDEEAGYFEEDPTLGFVEEDE